MPCKHEGGTDPCIRYKSGGCKVRQRQLQMPNSTFVGVESGRITAACELFVRADLSKRGYEVTVPVSPTARHDLHVDMPSVGWKGVQVKAAHKNGRTGRLCLMTEQRRTIQSPILALVFLPDNTIEYHAGLEPLPTELQE